MNEAARTLVQLAAPGPGGVHDFVLALRDRWRETGLASHTIRLSAADARALPLAARLRELVEVERRPCALLLHFSGYGFDKRGLCQWLVCEVEEARRQLGADLRVVTMFHELFASGPVWRSAFWLSGTQARLAARLARASDLLWTNAEHHARWLRTRVADTVPIEVHPVFSTVGEPEAVRPVQWRDRRLLVFGSESTRHRALAALPAYAAALRAQGLEEIIEAGSGAPFAWGVRDLSHRFVGRLGADALRALFEASAFALIDYPSRYLGKSTVFAAYAVHGCVVLNTADAVHDNDGLRRGVHYLSLRADTAIPHDAEARKAMAQAARHWYADHTIALQAEAFSRCCEAAPSVESPPCPNPVAAR